MLRFISYIFLAFHFFAFQYTSLPPRFAFQIFPPYIIYASPILICHTLRFEPSTSLSDTLRRHFSAISLLYAVYRRQSVQNTSSRQRFCLLHLS